MANVKLYNLENIDGWLNTHPITILTDILIYLCDRCGVDIGSTFNVTGNGYTLINSELNKDGLSLKKDYLDLMSSGVLKPIQNDVRVNVALTIMEDDNIDWDEYYINLTLMEEIDCPL